MKNKKYLITFASLALLTTFGAATAYAAGNFAGNSRFGAQTQQRRLEMQQIFENKNFTAWQNQMMERASEMEQKAQFIRNNATRENFNKMVQAHQLMQSGDTEAARKIMQEVHENWGFGQGGMHRFSR